MNCLGKLKFIVILNFRNLSHSSKSNKINYSKTVLLPKTKFPLKIKYEDKIKHNKMLLEKCLSQLYNWQKTNCKDPEFVLHDGPPYANGPPHMGHAINKILKDIILRYRIMTGTRVNYVPGWDCHGLPIELKAIQDNLSSNDNALTIRKKANKFALQTLSEQKKAFQSWGLVADWENGIYRTNSKDYVQKQLHLFFEFYERNLIFRDLKPVYWSPSTRTALAEAELVYNPNHTSKAIIVKFKMLQIPKCLKKHTDDCNVYALVWTTTPWTLPSNQAICYNPHLKYTLFKMKTNPVEYFLFCKNSIENSNLSIDGDKFEICEVNGYDLKHATYLQPIYKSELPFLPAEHVSDTKGTGMVHTAPAHGHEDFLVAINHNLKVDCMVDENGRFMEKAGVSLRGLSVLGEGNEMVLKLIAGDIVSKSNYVHSYPYDWRTNQPVIIRASHQWFIDTDKIKNAAINCLKSVNIFPQKNSEIVRNAMTDKLLHRPYWCISRQRVWGVPIPVFYNKNSGQIHCSRKFIEHLCHLIETYGTDFWWSLDRSIIIPEHVLTSEGVRLDDLILGQDILDIWFDSGISWSNVLGPVQADLYLEGIDQITGWFQSSLLTSVAITGRAPYKNLYVHGFVYDDKGQKMSKSLGNVVDPQEIMFGKDGYGTDVVRWWVASHAAVDMKVAFRHNVLQLCAESVQKIRSVLRFLLSNLYDYDFRDNCVAFKNEELHLIDRYILHLLLELCEEVKKDYDTYEFNRVASLIYKFIANYISALYCSSIKQRLYCELKYSDARKSAQFVVYQTLHTLCSLLSPLLPVLIGEVNMHMPEQLRAENRLINQLEIDPTWRFSEIVEPMKMIIDWRDEVNRLCMKHNISEMEVSIQIPDVELQKLKKFENASMTIESELTDIFQVANVTFVPIADSIDNLTQINVKKTNCTQCQRCRRFNCFGTEICRNCAQILEILLKDQESVAVKT